MKQAMSFRLSSQSIVALESLANELQMSKTEIIEQAIQTYIRTKKLNQPDILQFAGILSDDEAKGMLSSIRKDRRNKKGDIKL
jgi:hypothetical protein